MELKEREFWLDSLKGFTIILVVFGHCIDGLYRMNSFSSYKDILEIIHNVIYFFHMPLFFALSGYVFRKYLEKISILKYSVNLLALYFVFASIQLIIQIVMSKSLNHMYSVNDLLMLPIITVPPYWYIYVLALYYLIWHGKEKVFGYKVLLSIAIFMHILSLLVFCSYFEFHRLLYFGCFFILGYKLDQTMSCKYLFPSTLIAGIALWLLGGK